MEALDVGVLPRTARPDVERFDLPLFEPILDGISDKLRSVIAAQMLRRSVTRDGCFKHGDGIHGPDRPGRMQRQALPRMFIEQCQNAEAAAVVGLILNKIPAPYLPGFGCAQSLHRTQPHPAHPLLLFPHLHSFHPAQALHPFGINDQPSAAQQRRDAPVAIARVLLTQFKHLSADSPPPQTHRAWPIKTRTRQINCSAGLRRAAQTLFHTTLYRPTPARRAYHFFAFTSFKIWICTAWSATSRFKRPFSSSSPRKRRASSTSIPPYFPFPSVVGLLRDVVLGTD